jgi:hypothetical protein
VNADKYQHVKKIPPPEEEGNYKEERGEYQKFKQFTFHNTSFMANCYGHAIGNMATFSLLPSTFIPVYSIPSLFPPF